MSARKKLETKRLRQRYEALKKERHELRKAINIWITEIEAEYQRTRGQKLSDEEETAFNDKFMASFGRILRCAKVSHPNFDEESE